MLLLLVSLADAAEPDLSGVHLALGAGLEAVTGASGVTASPLEGALRLHVGPRWMVELGVSGGVTSDAHTGSRETLQDGEVIEADHEELVETGWAAAAGLRARFRVNAGGPVGLYLGVGAAYEHTETAGPQYGDVTDAESGETTIQEVGRYESEREEIALDASLAAVHWLSDRVSVSGVFSVPFATWDTRTEAEFDTTGAEEVADDRDTFENAAFGFWPRVGLAVHLRL